MASIQPLDFEEWWEQQGGDEAMSGRLDCAAPVNLADAKKLFQECFLIGVALGLKRLLLEEGK